MTPTTPDGNGGSVTAAARVAVEPRSGFLPPRVHVPRVERVPADWTKRSPILLLGNPAGTAPARRETRVWLAHDGDRLLLHAAGRDAHLTRRPEIPPGDAQFWTQDHLEFRLLLGSGEQLQCMVALDGRCWDNRGVRQQAGLLACRGEIRGEAWELDLTLACAALELPALQPGMTLRGLIAHVRWADGRPDIVCCGATELGFQQAERFAEFLIADSGAALPVVTDFRVADDRQAVLTIVNPAQVSFAGRLALLQERADGEAASELLPLNLSPGGTATLNVRFAREWRCFTRLCLAIEDTSGRHEFAAVSLRAELPPLPAPVAGPSHPCLYFDAAGVAEFRRKAARPAFHALAAGLAPNPSDYDEAHLPPPGGRFAFDFDAESMHWGRVARETMLRDGEGQRRPAAARLWTLLPPDAQEAFRAVARLDAAGSAHVAILVQACNDLLRHRDLYEAKAFADVRLPPEGNELLARGVATLDDFELTKLNRIILQSTIECCHKFKVDLASRAGSYLAKWLISGDARLVELATRTAQAAADSMIPEVSFHLHEGGVAPGLALAYDTFYPLLTNEQRAHWRRLLTKLLDLYLHSARTAAWTVTAIPNANPVSSAGAGFLALALWHEEPEKAREALGWIRRYIWNWLDYCAGADGGNTEGCQYWQYGTESWIRFAALGERFFGRDDGLLDHPALRNGMNMIRVALCNDGALHGVNDTVPVPCGVEIAWYWAGRYDDRFALWYGDHAWRWHRQGVAAGRSLPYLPAPLWSILFRPDLPEVLEQPEALPQTFALHSIEYGILRSGPEWNCRWTAGLKGSRPPYTHHNQADTGSFFVDYQGERLLIDPGYYKPEPTHHSLPIVNGVAPKVPSDYTGQIVACRDGYLACDATRAYCGAARRVIRHLVLVGDEGLVLLDDISAEGEVLTQFQAGASTRLRNQGRGVQIADLRLKVLAPATLRLTLQPERSLHDTHWGYHFAQCRWFPITGQYPADERQPLVAVFTAAGRAPRCRRTADTITITFPSRREVVFQYRDGLWIRL